MTKNSAASLKPLLTLSPSWLEIPACLSIASKQKRSGRGWGALQNGICPHAHPALPAHRPHSEVLQKAGSPPPGVPLACFFFTRVPYRGVGTRIVRLEGAHRGQLCRGLPGLHFIWEKRFQPCFLFLITEAPSPYHPVPSWASRPPPTPRLGCVRGSDQEGAIVLPVWAENSRLLCNPANKAILHSWGQPHDGVQSGTCQTRFGPLGYKPSLPRL